MSDSGKVDGTITISEDLTESWIRCQECGRKLFFLQWAIFAAIVIACPSCKSLWRILLGPVVEELDKENKV